ncbi:MULTISPECIES: CRISPR-associated helicase Cas3' [Brevibacillus]|uniref:CRISPR-associated helicase Cas3' n=1 Tax=Brevibacillus TaxID=55080 RepID=UPI00203C6EE2|nr:MULTISPECIES: CRISPR-associated helicase Cas3' [Brevibacillus]MCM3080620.1 CRISPR-associated helicase Cas3' [Brevibacillus invocatus]MCM3430763.1 CRISPR-associated helicase Cas3' [Brevibacillus invocatus]MDH4618961.1 CRISPR-associated helicase Cas3' [Brevibacillus sp. AY1]
MKRNRLMAKGSGADTSSLENAAHLLIVHAANVSRACVKLADCVGERAFHNMGMAVDTVQLRKHLEWFGWLHDLGKANSHFQSILIHSGHPTTVQMLRHEAVSGILMNLEPNLCKWLHLFPDDTRYLLLSAVVGHHIKFDRGVTARPSTEMQVLTSNPEWLEILQEISSHFQLPDPVPSSQNLVMSFTKRDLALRAADELTKLQRELEKWALKFRTNNDVKKRLALTKTLGIAGDVVASALGELGQSADEIEEYIDDHLVGTGLTQTDLDELLEKSMRSHGKAISLRSFQKEAATSTSTVTLIEAGCGSGKSLAAYLWAKSWCRSHPGRLFFCMPTMGTATEQYLDYALHGDVGAKLIHSKANVDLERIRTLLADQVEEDGLDASERFHKQQDVVESLAIWSTPLVVCTVDTVLGLLVNSRRALYSFPAIMNGLFVIDEIHALDERMFKLLLAFLKYFPNLPVLLMTASLPDWKKQLLYQVRNDLHVISGPQELEELQRYQLVQDVQSEEVQSWIRQTLADGGKVLWVRNQVEWAMETYRECQKLFPECDVEVYHSRFRYKDRSERHRKVIDQFKEHNKPIILVATQVAEMSLDLSADLLISDIAPIPALIQRLGRVNRRATPDQTVLPKPALILPLEGNNCNPYKEEELKCAQAWIASLIQLNRTISQKDLKEISAMHEQERKISLTEVEQITNFFSGMWETSPHSLREPGYTVPVLLESDVFAYRREIGKEPHRDWIREHEIQMPNRKEIFLWQKVRGIPVAPTGAIQYNFDVMTSRGEGATWSIN